MYATAKDGTRLHVRDWGEGAPVVFVASAGTSSDIWTQTIPAFLAAGHRCISFDRRGHGRSDEPGGGWDLDTLASDLACVVRHLELSDVVVVGHSLGGAEAIRYAAGEGAQLVRKLVLLAPTSPFLTKTADNPRGIDRALFEATWDAWRRDFPAWVQASARPFFDARTSEAMLQWGASLLTCIPLQVHLELGRVVAGTDLRPDLARLDVPTLVLHGEKDVSVPIHLGRMTAESIRGARLCTYTGAAHGLFLTHAEEVLADIFNFLRR